MNICRIVGAGDFTPALLTENSASDLLIAADGGLTALQNAGIQPDICIGDFDSLGYTPDGIEYYALPVEKDDTDLIAAIRLGLSRGYQKFELYGVLGGKRFSHSLAAVQTLFWLREHGGNGEIIDENCRIFTLENEIKTFSAHFSGTISIFTMEGAEVTLDGLHYPLDKYPLTCRFPLGVSNEFTGRESSVSVKGSVIIILE